MNNWQTKKLGEVLEKTETINPELHPDNEYKYVDISSVSNKTFSIESVSTIKGKNAPSRARKKIRNGDIIFATVRPTLKRLATIPENLDGQICSTGFFVLRNKKIISKSLLFYFLLTDEFNKNMEKLQRGTSYPAVTDSDIKNQNITFPQSLTEQQCIVSILDKAFATIDKAKSNIEQNIKNAKELFESDLRSVFEKKGTDWNEKKLVDITTKIGSGATPRGGNKSYKTEGIHLIRSMNVHDFEFREKSLAFIDEQQAKELNNVAVQEHDVLLNITGASVARCCIIPLKYLPARVNQHVSIIRAKQDIIDPTFLNLLLTSRFYKDQLLFTGEQGATRQAITKAQLEVFKVAFPQSLKTQQDVVKKLDALSTETKKLVAIYQAKVHELDSLKKSILQKAFSGELTTENIYIDTQVQA